MCEYRWLTFSCYNLHPSRSTGEIWCSACDAPVPGVAPPWPGRPAICKDKMFRFPKGEVNQPCFECFKSANPRMQMWQWRVNIIVALDIMDDHAGGNVWVQWMPCDEEFWGKFLYNDERGLASAA